MTKETVNETTELREDEVVAYLSAHPDFLKDHPALLEVLTIPRRHTGDAVLDMQHFAIDKLREELATVRRINDELILASRDNMSAQAQVHEAVVRLLQSDTLVSLLQIIRMDLAQIFDVDVVRLGLEMELGPDHATNDLQLMHLPAGETDRQIGEGKTVLLTPEVTGDPVVFGAEAGLVRSQVLVRLRIPARDSEGILAFGVRARGRFYPGQGTELLSFLGRIVEYALEHVLAEDA